VTESWTFPDLCYSVTDAYLQTATVFIQTS